MVVDIVSYAAFFLALYFEVFVLIAFLERRSTVRERGEQSYPSVAIIVPCWNEAKTLAATLSSLTALRYPRERLEIIVVDDGSRDETLAVAHAFAAEEKERNPSSPHIRVLHKENGGKHSALNLALAETTSELIGCLDADSVVESDALMRAVRAFENPSVGAVTPGIHVKDTDSFFRKIQHVEYRLSIFNRSVLAALGSAFITPGPFTIFRTAAVREIGGWRHAHATEDMEIALRLQEKSWRIVNNPRVSVHTGAPRTLRPLVKQRVRWTYGFLRNIWAYRHLLGNRSYGTLGLFVLPMALFSIFAALFFIARLLWLLGMRVTDLFIQINAGAHPKAAFDIFFFNTGMFVIITLVAIALTLVLISYGARLSKGSHQLPRSTPLFILLYGFLAPLWLAPALFKAIRGRGIAWR